MTKQPTTVRSSSSATETGCIGREPENLESTSPAPTGLVMFNTDVAGMCEGDACAIPTFETAETATTDSEADSGENE